MQVLIVQDQAETREAISLRLRRHFQDLQLTEVTTAHDLHRALQEGSFDLVLTGGRLSWTDGLQVLREVKARWPDVPVIMVSDVGDAETAAAGMRAGLSDYLLQEHLERLPAVVLDSLERAEAQRSDKVAIQELQQAEERYRTVAQLAADLAYLFRVDPDDRLVLEWTGGDFERLTGYTLEQARRLGGWRALVHEFDRPLYDQYFAQLLSGRDQEVEVRIYTRDHQVRRLLLFGQPFYDKVQGRVVRIWGGMKDITALHQYEAELDARVEERTAGLSEANASLQQYAEELHVQQEEMAIQTEELRQQTDELELRTQELVTERAQMQAIIENAPYAIVVADAQARVLLTNPAADRLYARPVPVGREYRSQAALQLRYPDGTLYDPRDLPLTRAALDGISLFDVEMTIVWPDGQRRDLWASAVPIRNKQDEITGAVGMFQDITEHRRSEQERERLLAQVRQDAATKASLLREVNHRVKNNLAAIVGLLYAQMDQLGAADKPEYRAMLLEVTRRIEGLSVVHGLLSAAQWRPLRLDDLAKRVVGTALQAVPAGQVMVDVFPSPVRVSSGQAHPLALVINELALNVAKHALQSGAPIRIAISASIENGNVVLVFRDNGPGYPEEVLAGQRAGVGLNLLRNLVRQNLRGQMALRNEGGAVAEIRFPADEEAIEGAERG